HHRGTHAAQRQRDRGYGRRIDRNRQKRLPGADFRQAGIRPDRDASDGPSVAGNEPALPPASSGLIGLPDPGDQLCAAWVTDPPVAVRPPSTTYCAPVMLLARSDDRNSTMLAISSGVV